MKGRHTARPPPSCSREEERRADDEERVLSSHFSSRERNYVRSLRRKQREHIVRLFEHRGTKRKRDEEEAEEAPLRVKVLQSSLPEPVRMNIFEDLHKGDPTDKYVNWVRKAIRLPIGVEKGEAEAPSHTRLSFARMVMDASVSGQEGAKREVLKMICQGGRGRRASYALGLEGPPGCGKTHFVKHALAPALDRPYVSIPLGGATDSSFLVGSSFTYEGSKEGRISAALVEAGCCNPVIHFDEVDKISRTERGSELEALLIHLVDPSEPFFRDKYFHGIDIDLSRCTFVFCYNDAQRVNPVLLDRIKRIRVDAPSLEERVDIVERHIAPRVAEKYDPDGRGGLRVSREAVMETIAFASRKEEGMRNAEKAVEHVMGSAALCLALGGGSEAAGVDAPVYDEAGGVSVHFARAVLAQLRTEAPCLPPCLMYT